MSLTDKIKDDLKYAMKSGEEVRLGVLRMLSSELYNKIKEKQAKGKELDLTDEEVVEVLQREFKKRNESIALFRKGGRNDLAEKEEGEIAVIKNYLPEQASDDEISKIVGEVIAHGSKDFGSAMREAVRRLKGRADGKRIGEFVKKSLGQ
ncbi:MAG: GatB/YqeY domain-containing protein [Patescibacteria group bacterium]